MAIFSFPHKYLKNFPGISSSVLRTNAQKNEPYCVFPGKGNIPPIWSETPIAWCLEILFLNISELKYYVNSLK